jgi:hypothetical protein
MEMIFMNLMVTKFITPYDAPCVARHPRDLPGRIPGQYKVRIIVAKRIGKHIG